MYRPPEMCDIYLGYKIDHKVDIWMIGNKLFVYFEGCVLYALCFFVHPFVEMQKLAIITGTFNIP